MTAAANRVLERRCSVAQSQLSVATQDRGAVENAFKVFKKESRKASTSMAKSMEELNLRCVRTEHLQATWKATIRKKESEYDKLQARMQSLMGARDRHVKKGISMHEGKLGKLEAAALEVRRRSAVEGGGGGAAELVAAREAEQVRCVG